MKFKKGGGSTSPEWWVNMLRNLQKDLQTNTKASLKQAKTTKISFDNSTNSRQLAFKDMKPLATKVFNALAISGATTLAVADAKIINRKIQGAKANGGQLYRD